MGKFDKALEMAINSNDPNNIYKVFSVNFKNAAGDSEARDDIFEKLLNYNDGVLHMRNYAISTKNEDLLSALIDF